MAPKLQEFALGPNAPPRKPGPLRRVAARLWRACCGRAAPATSPAGHAAAGTHNGVSGGSSGGGGSTTAAAAGAAAPRRQDPYSGVSLTGKLFGRHLSQMPINEPPALAWVQPGVGQPGDWPSTVVSNTQVAMEMGAPAVGSRGGGAAAVVAAAAAGKGADSDAGGVRDGNAASEDASNGGSDADSDRGGWREVLKDLWSPEDSVLLLQEVPFGHRQARFHSGWRCCQGEALAPCPSHVTGAGLGTEGSVCGHGGTAEEGAKREEQHQGCIL
jgi:hypothetical protein